jgi:plastocyanin
MKKFATCLLTLCVCLLAGSGAAQAQPAPVNCVWAGGSATSANWNSPVNWTDCNGGTPHTTGDNVNFPAGAARPVNIDNIGVPIGAMTIVGVGAGNVAWNIDATAAPLDFSSLTVTSPPAAGGAGPTIPAAIDFGNDAVAATITTHLAAGGPSTLTIGMNGRDLSLTAATLTFNLEAPVKVLSTIRGHCPGNGPTALIKDGPEELELHAGAYCGTTVINAGTLLATSSSSLGLTVSDVVFGGATAGRTASGDVADPSTLTQVKAGATLALANGVTIADTLALAGRLVVRDLGTATVTGDVIHASTAEFAMDNTLTLTGRVASESTPTKLVSTGGRLVLNGTLAMQLNGTAAGTTYDQLDLSSNLTLGAGAQLELTRGFDVPVGTAFKILSLGAGKTVTGGFANAPEGGTLMVNGQKFVITYRGGDGNDVMVVAAEEAPAPTYYLSEGSTGPFFDTDILIANPNSVIAPVTLTFSKEDGQQVTASRNVPAQGRLTVHLDQIQGLESTAVSTQVRSENRLPLVVERTMFWDQSYYAGSTGSSVAQPGPDWYFAEGSQGFFQTFVLVINPNPTPTDVTFTFFRENDTPVTKTVTVGAATRFTLDTGTVAGLINRSFGITVHGTQPIMAERSMYFGTTPTRLWSGGTESAGVPAPSTHWFLAEGATGGFFDTFVELSNPQNSDAHVQFQYLLPTGETITVQKVVLAHERLTQNIETEDDIRLHNTAVSTVVTSDVPVVAERSMYWPGAAIPWGEGHDSFGVVEAGTTWGLAEGRIGGPLNFHTYILLANPQTTAAHVTVTFVRETGAPVVKTYTVAATSRFNIDSSAITELHDENFGAIIQVTNNVPIIVERSMYWDSNGFSFSGGTNATGIALPDDLSTSGGVQVSIVGINGAASFAPNPVTMLAGQSLSWKDNDGVTHRLVADDASFDTGNISGGATSIAVMPHAGATSYHCSIHPSMTGTINAAASATSARP